MFAPIANELLQVITEHSPIVEIGSGDGLWAHALRNRGATVKAFDIYPRGEDVMLGDHLDAATHNGTLLMIWPPDGSIIQQWIIARKRSCIILIANLARLTLGNVLADYKETWKSDYLYGHKGSSRLMLFEQ